MPTIRWRKGRRGYYYQVQVRLKGFQQISKAMPPLLNPRDKEEKAKAKKLALEWGLEREREQKQHRALGETPTMVHELQEQWTFNDLISNYMSKIQISKATELARIFDNRGPQPVYIYNKPRKKSYENEWIMIRSFCKDMDGFCKQPTSACTHLQIQEYINKKLQEGKSAATVIRYLSPIRHIWRKESKLLGLKLPNIFSKEDLIFPDQIDNHSERYLKPEEEPYLFKAIESLRFKKQQGLWNVYVSMVLSTAMRRGELLRITWANLDFNKLTIEVPGRFAKNGQRRLLPMTKNLAYFIELYRDTLSDVDKEPDALVIPMTASGAEQAWRRITRKATLLSGGKYKLRVGDGRHPDSLTLHSLKHTALTRFAHKPYALSDRERQYLGAHKGFRQTDRYEHIDLMESIREKLEKVDDLRADDDSVSDIAFYRQFDQKFEHTTDNGHTTSKALPGTVTYPTDKFPDLDWIERDGRLVIDVNGAKSKAYFDKEKKEHMEQWLFAQHKALIEATGRQLTPEGAKKLLDDIRREYAKELREVSNSQESDSQDIYC
jgi:integrase